MAHIFEADNKEEWSKWAAAPKDTTKLRLSPFAQKIVIMKANHRVQNNKA